MKAKFVDNGIPLIVGEYGAGAKDVSFSPTVQRIYEESYTYYHKYVVESMKKNGMVPFVWDPGTMINRNDYSIKNEPQWEGIQMGAYTSYPSR